MAGQRKANSEREPIWRREEELVDLSKVPNRDMRCLPLYYGSGVGAIKVLYVISRCSVEAIEGRWTVRGVINELVVGYQKLYTQGGRPAKSRGGEFRWSSSPMAVHPIQLHFNHQVQYISI